MQSQPHSPDHPSAQCFLPHSPFGIWRQPHVTSLMMILWLFWAVTSAPCSEHLTVTLLPVLIPLLLQVCCYYTRLCIPTNICWGKGQVTMTSRPESKREVAQEAYALSKRILPTLPRMSLLKKQSRKHLQKQMLPDEPMFSVDINKGCRKAHNETQTKAKGKWQKPVRTTMDSWRSELTEVCKQCKGKSNRKISGMLRGWRDKK